MNLFLLLTYDIKLYSMEEQSLVLLFGETLFSLWMS